MRRRKLTPLNTDKPRMTSIDQNANDRVFLCVQASALYGHMLLSLLACHDILLRIQATWDDTYNNC